MARHLDCNMVGSLTAHYSAPLWKRYIRVSKHSNSMFKSAIKHIRVAIDLRLGFAGLNA